MIERKTIMSIGKRLRFFRKRAQMTQKELGLLVGFNPLSAEVRIAQYESGERTPRWMLREKLASALGVASAALSVPNIETDREFMHLLFALEDRCHITVTEFGADFRIEVPYQGFAPLGLDLLAWKDKQEQLLNDEITKEEYDNWRYNF